MLTGKASDERGGARDVRDGADRMPRTPHIAMLIEALLLKPVGRPRVRGDGLTERVSWEARESISQDHVVGCGT